MPEKNNKKRKINRGQFKAALVDLFDEFVVAVHNANLARKEKPLEEEVTYTFENFMKWALYERNKQLDKEIIKNRKS